MRGVSPHSSTAEKITRASKSNLALAFMALPRNRRHDMSVFYAFCRGVDDIADDPDRKVQDRFAALNLWRQSIVKPTDGEPPLAPQVRGLIAKYHLPVEHFHEIIEGMEMDLRETRYETFKELKLYCYRVASMVGLVSIEIFGYSDPACRDYAVELGTALQLTNILRDIGYDYANGGRIYLPRVDMDHFGYDVGALAVGEHNRAFDALMNFEATRAFEFYRNAESALPASERRAMIAAEIMRTIYKRLLRRMQRDDFRVFTRKYRLSGLEKAACILRVVLRTRLS